MKKISLLSILFTSACIISPSFAAVTVNTYEQLQNELANPDAEIIVNRADDTENFEGNIIISENQNVTFENISNWIYEPASETDTTRLIVSNGTTSFNNVNFENNKLYLKSNSINGGAIIFNNNYIKEISNALFNNNEIKSIAGNDIWGGLIVNHNHKVIDVIKDSTFSNNTAWTAQSSPHGAVIYNGGTIKLIDNVTFENNSMTAKENNTGGAHGVALDNNQYGVINKITNSKFINNKTYKTGTDVPTGNHHASGGAFDNYNIIDEISNTIFERNATEVESRTAKSMGGAIKNTYAGANIGADGIINNVLNVDFIENHALNTNGQAHGGAIATTSSSTIGKMFDVTFKSNYVEGGLDDASQFGALGGAIYNTGYIGEISGSFTENYAINKKGASKAGGGAIYHDAGYNGKIEKISATFSNNYAKSATGSAFGGAIYNIANIDNIINSNFIDNYVEGDTNSKGGAIYTNGNLTITADNGTSAFSGNKVNSESNAIYLNGTENAVLSLNLEAKNKGTITFDDAIDGQYYDINIKGDVCPNCFVNSVAFNNVVSGVQNLTLDTTQMVLGKNAEVYLSGNYTAKNNPLLRVEVDLSDNKAGFMEIMGNVYGKTSVIVDTKNYRDVRGEEGIMFAGALGDVEYGKDAFSVARVVGSPYMWNVEYEEIHFLDTDGTISKIWSLAMNDTENTYTEDCNPTPEDDDPDENYESTPEVIGGIGLHTAGIEQTRTVVRNVSGKVANARSYCPNCGIVSDAWDGKQLYNGWVLAQGEYSNIDKPVDMEAKIWGVEGGFDMQSDMNNTFGIFASYRNGEYDLSGKGSRYRSNIGSEIEIDSYLAGLYYRYDKNMNWLFATVYGGTQDAEAKTDDGVASFETDGLEFGVSAEIGHSFALNRTTIMSPSLGVYYTQINYDDANDNVGKKYKWDDIKHLEAELALSLAKNFENGKVYIKPSVIQTLTDDDKVSITGLNEIDTYHDQTLGRVEIGGNYGFNDNWSAYGWANYTFGSSYDATSLGLGVNYSW